QVLAYQRKTVRERMALEIHRSGEEQSESPDVPGTCARTTGDRTPYRSPCLRRLGNIADGTKGTGTGPDVLVGGLGAGQGKLQIRAYGYASAMQCVSVRLCMT